jgi:hypothetical protein
MTANEDQPGRGLEGAGPGQSDPLRLGVELVLFALAAAALALTGPVVAAVVFAVIAIGVALLLRVAAPGS